ncbi:uncharacterized protein LOC135923977 isoform X1 [Gordionus sp. m RMFG-2023]|uniref:uncharacterized protein LOC135923977 isoform X1 n=1 Tax=Gordionus sp. m RMFG-2023 TaxID=3053472 RepID=UPI0031FC17AB
MESFLLDLIELPYPHSGEDISQCLLESLDDFEIQDKIISITHDNALNVIKAVEKMNIIYQEKYKTGVYSHRCLAHVINLIVKEGFSYLDKKLIKITDVVKKLHSSPKLLQNYMQLSGGTRIPLDVITRWNSKYIMLSTVNKNLDAIKDLGKKYMAPFDINDSEARSLNEIENFLKPFYKITLEISSDTSTIGTSVLFMTKIEQILDETSKNHPDSDLKKAAMVGHRKK